MVTANTFGIVKLLKEQQINLLLPFILIQTSFLSTTNAVPAKLGVSSYALGANSVNSLQFEGKHKVSSDAPIRRSMKIVVYPWNNHLGRPGIIEWSSEEAAKNVCKEIPSRWQGKVRSVHTHNNCFVLHSLHNCEEGPKKIVKIGSPSHNRLSDICFQRKPMSVRPCTQEEIDAPVTDQV